MLHLSITIQEWWLRVCYFDEACYYGKDSKYNQDAKKYHSHYIFEGKELISHVSKSDIAKHYKESLICYVYHYMVQNSR